MLEQLHCSFVRNARVDFPSVSFLGFTYYLQFIVIFD